MQTLYHSSLISALLDPVTESLFAFRAPCWPWQTDLGSDKLIWVPISIYVKTRVYYRGSKIDQMGCASPKVRNQERITKTNNQQGAILVCVFFLVVVMVVVLLLLLEENARQSGIGAHTHTLIDTRTQKYKGIFLTAYTAVLETGSARSKCQYVCTVQGPKLLGWSLGILLAQKETCIICHVGREEKSPTKFPRACRLPGCVLLRRIALSGISRFDSCAARGHGSVAFSI